MSTIKNTIKNTFDNAFRNTILIVEDDKRLNDGIRLALKDEEISFIQCRMLQSAREALAEHQVSLVLLDINLPDGDGMDFLKELREKSDVPIIILTANNMETDIVTGLSLGADDYITKPFSLAVLRARVDVQLRARKQSIREYGIQGQYAEGDFLFNFDRMQFSVAGEPLELSRTEQRLLRLLIENKGATLKRSRLIDEVWSGDAEYVDEHALTVAVKRLRDKVEKDSANPQHIKTVYGIGYTWTVGS